MVECFAANLDLGIGEIDSWAENPLTEKKSAFVTTQGYIPVKISRIMA